jgi:glucose/arabinose dehydrogenase
VADAARTRAPVLVAALAALLVVAAAGCGGGSGGSDDTSGASATSGATTGTTGTPGAAGATTTAAADGLVDIGAGLRGPAGLHADVLAQGPANVAAFAEDPEHRLWLATAASTDTTTDGVWVVPADGAAPVQVISGLTKPLGLLWIGDALYVASTGEVTRSTGFDPTTDTFATHDTVLTLPAGVGESNGLVQTPDGRILLGISAPCDHCTPTSPYSAAIVAFRPDGSDLQVWASGIRAPIGLQYLPGTDELFVTMDQRDDLGDATPGDWLSVVAEGDQWGFPDCWGQTDDTAPAACADVPYPLAVLDPHAAASGLAIVTGQLGEAVGTAAVVAEWATGQLVQVPLWTDGTPTTASPAVPFVTGVAHPVAVLVRADGSLVVGDWTSGTLDRIVPETGGAGSDL